VSFSPAPSGNAWIDRRKSSVRYRIPRRRHASSRGVAGGGGDPNREDFVVDALSVLPAPASGLDRDAALHGLLDPEDEVEPGPCAPASRAAIFANQNRSS